MRWMLFCVSKNLQILLCDRHMQQSERQSKQILPPKEVTSHPDHLSTLTDDVAHIFCRFFSFRRGGCCCRRADKK